MAATRWRDLDSGVRRRLARGTGTLAWIRPADGAFRIRTPEDDGSR